MPPAKQVSGGMGNVLTGVCLFTGVMSGPMSFPGAGMSGGWVCRGLGMSGGRYVQVGGYVHGWVCPGRWACLWVGLFRELVCPEVCPGGMGMSKGGYVQGGGYPLDMGPQGCE